jgi:outer membrane protein assembly factor BamB
MNNMEKHPARKSQNLTLTVMAVGSLLLQTSLLSAQDWPQWRGANRDGKVSGFIAPQTWPTNLTQKWKVTVGKGDSTPVLVGNKLYAFGRQDTDEVILCLDRATGKTVWEAKYPADYVVKGAPAGHPGPRSTPVVADGKICTLGVGGILSCLDAGTGAVLWRKQSTNDYLGVPYRSDSSMSPIVVDGKCIVHVGAGAGAAFMAFDLPTGKNLWKTAGEPTASSSPMVMTVGGAKQLITMTGKKIVGVGVADGRLLWEMPFEARQGNNTTPLVDGTTVYFTGQGKGLVAAQIAAQGDTYTVTTLWTNAEFGARFTSPVLKDGLLYGYGGRFFCVKAATGESLWAESGAAGQTASIVDAGSTLVALSNRGELIAYKPGTKEYTELARIKVASTETWPHPVLAGKQIYIKEGESVGLWELAP